MSPSPRAAAVLGRFPRHLEADAPGKLFESVADALSRELDVKTAQLGRVRRSHALRDADEERDVLLLAGLHRLRDDDLELLRLRIAAVARLTALLADEDLADEDVAAALEELPVLVGLDADAFPEPAPSPIAASLRRATAYGAELDRLRETVAAVIGLHRTGNGTVGALLGAAAAYLVLALEEVAHDEEGFWHLGRARDRLRLVAEPTGDELEPAPDLLALEENPFQPKELDPVARRHGERFRIVRGGLEPVIVSVRVIGVEDRTVVPMVVNVDTGVGVTYLGSVPDGEELRFGSDGSATLAGASVATRSFSFRGAVFADADALAPGRDFVFADEADSEAGGDRAAAFVVTRPVADAFAPGGVPHAGGLLDAATLALGETRWGFFVRVGHYGTEPLEAVPSFGAGVFDASVWAAMPGEVVPPAGAVGFAWQEREPFALTVWVPRRFAALDAEGEPPVRERLRALLERHRAAGVHVYVSYADERWSVGTGLLRDLDSDDPRGLVVVGTTLWPDETPQPTPT